jgi:hypothetical protein
MIGTLAAPVEKCLQSFGYSYHTAGEGADYRFECVVEEGVPLRSQLVVDEENHLLRHFVFLTDCGYPSARMPWVAELAARLDEAVAILGSIGFDWNTGTAFYRYGVDCRDQLFLLPDDIERILNSAAFPVKVWRLAFGNIDRLAVTPKAAATAALIEAGADCALPVTDETRRALLRLIC